MVHIKYIVKIYIVIWLSWTCKKIFSRFVITIFFFLSSNQLKYFI